MKKILLAVLITATAIFGLQLIQADEVETGTVVFHFKSWNDVYEDDEGNKIGVHAWGGTISPMAEPSGQDDFGIYFEWKDVEVGTTPGFIAVYQAAPSGDWQDWGRKQTGNVEPGDIVRAGVTTHVYAFEDTPNGKIDGGKTSSLVTYSDVFSTIVVYFDSTNGYEDELGIYGWGDTFGTGPAWGTVETEFENIGHSAGGIVVKGVAFNKDEAFTEGDGFIVVDGATSKKTGNVETAVDLTEIEAGEPKFIYVNNVGNLEDNSNVYEDYKAFYTAAFEFSLQPYNNVTKSGTFAPSPLYVNVKTSNPVASPLYGVSTDKEDEARAEVLSWFTLKEIVSETDGVKTFGPAIAIKSVAFAGTETIQDFVLELAEENKLDNTKRYEVFFDNTVSLEEDAEPSVASLEVNLDKSAPVITFHSSNDDVPIISVPYGKKWNPNLFPSFDAKDDRDGDITHYVYMESGEGKSIVNTGVKGDYTIILYVEDSWGNLTEASFVLRVA